jgi:DNA-nicking Smr family endonuclease
MDWKPVSRKRALTAEEAELWAFVTRDARALRRRDRSHKPSSPASDPPALLPFVAPNQPAKSAPPVKSGDIQREKPIQPKSPPLSSFDENERRRLGRNPDLIDARLDLHGLRQREAHAALRSFLFSCSVRGFRHALIITGKGAPAERQRDFFGEERGVLRRLVPQWLSEPDLRGIVVSYAVSHIRHGGEGALYVRLRKAGATLPA